MAASCARAPIALAKSPKVVTPALNFTYRVTTG
jgi:hypothetical protein